MDGTPLPAALTGNMEERVIRLDTSLFYLVNGALQYLLDKEPLEETGTLTIDDAKIALSEMFYRYLWGSDSIMPIGALAMWPTSVPPDGWALCEGGNVAKVDYPLLYDVIGDTFGTPIDSDHFVLPDFQNLSPMGAGIAGTVDIGETAGELNHVLTTGEIPSHNHQQTVNNTTPAVRFTAGGGTVNTFTGANSSSAIPITTQLTGGGAGHNTLHPVIGIKFIIRGA